MVMFTTDTVTRNTLLGLRQSDRRNDVSEQWGLKLIRGNSHGSDVYAYVQPNYQQYQT